MIIWSGKGLLVVLAMGLGMLAGRVAAQMLAAHIYFSSAAQMDSVGFVFAAGFNFVLSRLFVSDASFLFLIPNRYWTVILAAMGILLFFKIV